jgi:hypothetical protein
MQPYRKLTIHPSGDGDQHEPEWIQDFRHLWPIIREPPLSP